MSSANSDSSISFPIWIPLTSFPSLIAIPRTFKAVLNKNGENGHTCLLPDPPREWCQLFTIEHDIRSGFIKMFFIMLTYISSNPTLMRVFIMNGCWILPNMLSVSWHDHVIFILPFVNVTYHTDWFANTELSLCPWNKSCFIMVYGSFYILLVPFANMLLRAFACIFIKDIYL